MLFKPWKTAVLAIDWQKFCFSKGAQGTDVTEQVASELDYALNVFDKRGIPVIALYSKATNLNSAGLHPSLLTRSPTRKTHESAFTGSSIAKSLERMRRDQLILIGFHTTACVKLSAISALSLGFRVAIANDFVGEGQRGRNLTTEEIGKKSDKAFSEIQKRGGDVRPLSQIIA